MLKIAEDILPADILSYVAFRIAFCETWERYVLCRQLESRPDEVVGYLDEVPFLNEVPVHVQLDLLADTWSRHLSGQLHAATLVDEAVIYAVSEFSAAQVERQPKLISEFLASGPLPANIAVDPVLASALRDLHLKLSNDGDFLLISQFLDIEPETANSLKREFGMDVERVEALFEALGRWHVGADVAVKTSGLLDSTEQRRLAGHLQNVVAAPSV